MGAQGVPAVMEAIVEAGAVAVYVDNLGCCLCKWVLQGWVD